MSRHQRNTDQVVNKVLRVWENASSDSEDEMHRKNDSLILKCNDKWSNPINEDNQNNDAKKGKITCSQGVTK